MLIADNQHHASGVLTAHDGINDAACHINRDQCIKTGFDILENDHRGGNDHRVHRNHRLADGHKGPAPLQQPADNIGAAGGGAAQKDQRHRNADAHAAEQRRQNFISGVGGQVGRHQIHEHRPYQYGFQAVQGKFMPQKAPRQQQQRNIDAEDSGAHRDFKQVVQNDRNAGHSAGSNIIGAAKAV